MPWERLREHLVATACVAFIVWVAFLAAYSDTRTYHGQETPRVETNQQAKGAAKSEPVTKEQDQRAEDTLGPSKHLITSDLDKEGSRTGDERAEQGSEYWPFLIFGFRLKVTDSLLAVFTAFLVVIGAYQGWQLLRTVTGANEIAEANVALESPILVIGRMTAAMGFPIEIAFTNYGRSPAIVVADCLELVCKQALPANPTYPSESVYAHDVEAVVTTSGSYIVERPDRLTLEEWIEISTGKKALWGYGYVEYLTFLKIRRREGFCVAFRPFPSAGENVAPTLQLREVRGTRAGPSSYTFNIEVADSAGQK